MVMRTKCGHLSPLNSLIVRSRQFSSQEYSDSPQLRPCPAPIHAPFHARPPHSESEIIYYKVI